MGFSALPLSQPRLPPGGPPGHAIRRRTARRVQPEAGDRPFAPLRRASPAALDRSPRKWPDRPTRTAWPLPPLSAAQFAPSSLSGSSWHPSDSSRRSAAPTPCTLSQTRSSADTLFGEKSPPAVHAEPASCRLARQPLVFLSTSLNFDTVIILSLRARGEPGGGQSLPRRAPGDSPVSVRPVHVRPGCSGARPSCCPVAA